MQRVLIATAVFGINAALLAHLGKEMPIASFAEAPEAMQQGILAAVDKRIASPNDNDSDLEGDALLQERIFHAVVDALKDLPDVAAAVVAPPGEGFTPIRYIGHREPHIDGAFGTKIMWGQAGDTRLVPEAIAKQMLAHTAVYERGEAQLAPAAVPLEGKRNEDDDPAQIAREAVTHMTKAGLTAYAKTNYRIDLDPKTKADDMRARVIGLIDQYGPV